MPRLPTFLLLILVSGCSLNATTCRRMKDLCNTEQKECEDIITSTKEVLGDSGVDSLKRCFAEATSCAEASGCMAGAGIKGLGQQVDDFFRGMKKALDKEK